MVRKGLLYSIPLLLLIAALAAAGWVLTPAGEPIPLHWSASGEVNRSGGHVEAFLAIPGLAALLTLIFAFAPFIDPRGRNLQRSQPLWLTAWLGSLALLVISQGIITLSAVGLIDAGGATVPRAIGSFVAVFFIIVGNVLGKARPNWFAGIRTPWSLSSDRSWDITHRWAARLFFAAGLVSLAAIWLLDGQAGWIVMLATISIAALVPVVISYIIWRRDPRPETYSADMGVDD